MRQPHSAHPMPETGRRVHGLLDGSEARRGRRVAVMMLAVMASLVGSGLSGCSMTRWLKVAPGEYVVTRCPGESCGGSSRAVQRLRVDGDDDVAVFTLTDGSEITSALTRRERAYWPSGCPTTVLDHFMEVLDVAEPDMLEALVGSATVVLVRDCPRDPVRVVLRADGDIGNARGSAGTACSWTDSCICFAPTGEPGG